MTIYIPMIILTVFLADIQERIRYRGRKISILLITLLPPTLVAAFRYNNGADYPMYFQLFTRLGNGSKIAGIEGKKLEVGFEYIVRLCQLVTRNQWFTFGAISFIISFLIFKECLNDSDDYRLSVLFYFVTGVYFDAYNGLRQYIAVSICFYQGLEEYGYITGRSVVIKCISLALLVVFVKTREDYVAYALLTSLALGGNYIFNVIHARKMVGFTLVNLKIRKHIKPIVFIAGIIFMSTIYNKIDITMLSALSTDEAVGYYSYAQRTVNIVLTMCSAVTAIFLPRLSYYYDNEKAVFYKLMDKGFQILCLGVVPLAVGLFLTANQAVVLLYGDSFTPTGTTIKLMCPLILIKGFGDLLCYQLAYSSKNEYILLPGSAIASIINVITNSILIPLYAQNGAVIASVMSELTTNIIQFLYLKRKIKYHISNTALVLSLFSTMVMAAVVCAIIKMNLPLAVALAMEISIGGAIYLLMNIALKNRILSEMLTKVLKKHNTGFQDS